MGGNNLIAASRWGGLSSCCALRGQLDELGLCDRAPSSAEVMAIAQAGSAGKCKPAGSISYCTAKINSCGITPAISSTGIPSASATSGFTISSSDAKANKFGLLIYTDQGRRIPAAPFAQGGWLCLNTPIRRGPAVMSSGGRPGQCDAVFSIDMNCFAAGNCAGNPASYLSMAGTMINCQWWGRDDPNTSFLSDALEFTICP